MNQRDKFEALINAAQEYGAVVHGDWKDAHGTVWLDIEFPNTVTATLCLANYHDLTDGAQPRDAITSFTAALVVQIPIGKLLQQERPLFGVVAPGWA